MNYKEQISQAENLVITLKEAVKDNWLTKEQAISLFKQHEKDGLNAQDIWNLLIMLGFCTVNSATSQIQLTTNREQMVANVRQALLVYQTSYNNDVAKINAHLQSLADYNKQVKEHTKEIINLLENE